MALAAVPATPTNLTIVGGQYTNDTTPTFTWTAVPGATHYDYKMNDDNYRGLGNVTSFTSPTVRDGWHTFTLRAQDGTGNNSSAATVTFEVDTQGPTLSAMTPTTATVAQQITLSTTASGEAWTSSCRLNVDGADVGTMHERNQTFSLTTTFSATGKHKVFATCVDGDGNTTVGSATTMTVNASWQAGGGSIIKTTGSSTVYYYGDDGFRHAFPNEATYWSWYDNYDSLRVVTDSFLASLPWRQRHAPPRQCTRAVHDRQQRLRRRRRCDTAQIPHRILGASRLRHKLDVAFCDASRRMARQLRHRCGHYGGRRL